MLKQVPYVSECFHRHVETSPQKPQVYSIKRSKCAILLNNSYQRGDCSIRKHRDACTSSLDGMLMAFVIFVKEPLYENSGV